MKKQRPALAKTNQLPSDAVINSVQIGQLLTMTGIESVPRIFGGTKDIDPAVRLAAVSSLGSFSLHSEHAFDGLIAALKDPDALVRLLAVIGIDRSGTNAVNAVSALISALNDSDMGGGRVPGQVFYVRAFAARALGRLGPKAKSAAPALWQLFELERENRSQHGTSTSIPAAIAIYRTTSDPQRVLPFLIERLEDPKSGIYWSNCEAILVALGEMGPEAHAAVPAIEKLLQSDTSPGEGWNVRSKALEAHAKITSKTVQD